MIVEEAVATYGVTSGLVVFLVWWLTQKLDARLKTLNDHSSEAIRQRDAMMITLEEIENELYRQRGTVIHDSD